MIRVLVIDDDDMMRRVACMILTKVGGMEVSETDEGGMGALRIAESTRPDVIALDLMMPGVDGLETLAMLRACESTKDIPVCMLAAPIAEDLQAILVQEGANGFIAKPFEPSALCDKISSLALSARRG